MTDEQKIDPAEARVRAFRDAVSGAADALEAGGAVDVGALLATLRDACAAVEDDDLGADAATIGAQFDAMFERLESLAAAHPGPVAADSLGLPGDARFLRDMAVYLTRRYGLEEDEE